MLGEFDWNPGNLVILLIFGLPIVAVVTGVWRKVEQHRAEVELKQKMVERGMSVDEIERVIAAGSKMD